MIENYDQNLSQMIFRRLQESIVYSLWLENIPRFSSVVITTILNSLIAGI